MDYETIHINGSEPEDRIIGYRLGGNAEELYDLLNKSNQPQFLHKMKRIVAEIKYAEINFKKFCLLTNREKEIITLIASGYNNPIISEKLYISRRTVEQHRKNINRKLKINSFREIYLFACAFNLI